MAEFVTSDEESISGVFQGRHLELFNDLTQHGQRKKKAKATKHVKNLLAEIIESLFRNFATINFASDHHLCRFKKPLTNSYYNNVKA